MRENNSLMRRNGNGMRSIWDIFNEPFFNSGMEMMSGGTFKVDVKDKGNAYEILADIPSVKKEDIELSYEKGYLTIKAKSANSVDEKDEEGNYLRRERHYGSMSRSFYIEDIDEEKIEAEYKDGTLKIELPKVKEEQVIGRKIMIK